MTTDAKARAEPRQPLTRERVLRTAVRIADRDGLEALTMRNLAQELGVEAMSLYHHVANKEAVLDGVVDVVGTEIEAAASAVDAPAPADAWKTAMRRRILAAREVLLRHPWVPEVMDTRTTASPSVLRYYDGVLGLMRAGGFSYELAHHALHALGSRALGYTRELFEGGDADERDEAAAAALEELAGQLPHLVEMMTHISHSDPDSTLGWCDDQVEFEFALDLILDGLDRLREGGGQASMTT
jgi:AcrR family transcriptional regulator